MPIDDRCDSIHGRYHYDLHSLRLLMHLAKTTLRNHHKPVELGRTDPFLIRRQVRSAVHAPSSRASGTRGPLR